MLENPPDQARPIFYLHPGEARVVDQPAVITTLLGSCVAVTFYSPRYNIAAMCHSMLPTGRFASKRMCFRYVDCAVGSLVESIAQRQERALADIEVKLFGGAAMFPKEAARWTAEGGTMIGNRNVDTAREVLDRLGLSPVFEQVGGRRGYKINFHTGSGDVYWARIESLANGWRPYRFRRS